MHPTLTTTVYAIIAILLVSVAIYMFLYTRGLHTKKAVLDEKGRLPLTREEGISVATLQKEKLGRAGTIT